MIPVNALQYAFLQQAETTDSKYIKQLSVVQRDYYLNRAKDLILEIYAQEAERNSTIADYLLDVTIRDFKLETELKDGFYIANYPVDYYHTLALYVDAEKQGCTEARRFPVRRPTSDKLRRALKNANVKRFWDFEETVAIQANKGFQVYTEEGLSYEVFIDYIKKIPDVAAPEFEGAERYIDTNGEVLTQNKNLEINNNDLFHKIISVATLLSKRDRNLVTDYELQLKTLLSLDRI